MRDILSEVQSSIKAQRKKLKGEPFVIWTLQRDKVPMGQPPSVLKGRAGRGRNGRDGPGTQEGRRVWSGLETQRALHSARGRRRIRALCGCWMASRSSTNTPLWLWKGLLSRATDLLDTPSAALAPALKVNTRCLWLVVKALSWYSASYERRILKLPGRSQGEAKQFNVGLLYNCLQVIM